MRINATADIAFPRFFSTDSAKAVKAQGYGWLNAINYMAPARAAGVGNLCSHASPGCIALCLGLWSGQAAMVSRDTGTNSVRDSRERKARYFMKYRNAYMCEMALHVATQFAYARKKKLRLAVRPNGSTDVAYEGIRFDVDTVLAKKIARKTGQKIVAGRYTLFELFPFVQFVDYTKNPGRFKRPLPSNYSLTFSRSESNETQALELLAAGVNVSVVSSLPMPDHWHGFPVIDGDQHDLRHLDPRGVAVWLTPKGNKAKKDTSGFVVRSLAA